MIHDELEVVNRPAPVGSMAKVADALVHSTANLAVPLEVLSGLAAESIAVVFRMMSWADFLRRIRLSEIF